MAAAAVAAAAGVGPADAGAIRVENTFRVDYELTADWKKRVETQGTVAADALSYTLKGRLPDVRFEDAVLQGDVSATVLTTVEGDMSTAFSNPEGTSSSCSGGPTQVAGMVGLGHVPGTTSIWLLPAIGARATGTCQDTDGGTPEGTLAVGVPTPKPSGVPGLRAGAQRFAPRFADLDTGSWSGPVKLSYTGAECGRPEEGGTCSLDFSGTLRLTRTARRLVQNDADDLLAPVQTPKPPRLDPRKREGKATVRCPRACDIEAIIGVFGQKNGKPHISYPVRRRQRLKAQGSATVRVPLSARARKAAKEGMAVMALDVGLGGKRLRATYPLR
jgi:hypothetical protein